MRKTPTLWRQTFRFVVFALALSSSALAQTKRAVTFDDVLNVKAVGGAAISPDGSQVLYTVRQWVAEKDPSTPPSDAQASLRAGRMEARTLGPAKAGRYIGQQCGVRL